jgi:uncharacterized membrane protein
MVLAKPIGVLSLAVVSTCLIWYECKLAHRSKGLVFKWEIHLKDWCGCGLYEHLANVFFAVR